MHFFRHSLALTFFLSGCGVVQQERVDVGGDAGTEHGDGNRNQELDGFTLPTLDLVIDEDQEFQGYAGNAQLLKFQAEFQIITQPAKGKIVFDKESGKFTYKPNLNEHGSDKLTYSARLPNGKSLPEAAMNIKINPLDDRPALEGGNYSVQEDKTLIINALVSDPDSLRFFPKIDAVPNHGKLKLNGFNSQSLGIEYLPNENYSGVDTFKVSVNDGTSDSNPATFTVRVDATNDAPITTNSSLTINEDSNGVGTLSAQDPEGSPLTFSVYENGKSGSAEVTNPSTGAYIYRPHPNANGSDYLTFRVSDGEEFATVSVAITISPIPDAPTASSSNILVAEDSSVSATLVGSDPDTTNLTYSIVNNGSKGTASIDNAATGAFTYRPNPNVTGNDSFSFKISDGFQVSEVATVTVVINPVNDRPVSFRGSLNILEDTVGLGTLSGSDLDGDRLNYVISTAPSKGTVVIDASTGNYRYTPRVNATGSDWFSFTAYDGTAHSIASTISVNIGSENDAPFAAHMIFGTPEDTPKTGNFEGYDVDLDIIRYSIVSQPQHGTVVLNSAQTGFTYSPSPNYYGTDSFTFQASDGSLTSNVARISIGVTAVNDIPIANPANVSGTEDTRITATLSGSDLDGSALIYSISSNPSKGTISAFNPSTGAFTYTPYANANGTDSFSFRVFDGYLYSSSAPVSIQITPVNDAPESRNGTLTVDEDRSYSGRLQATDIDSSALTYQIVSQPTKGRVTVTNASTGDYTYTPNLNANGADLFTFTATDGEKTSTASSMAVTINPVDDPITYVAGPFSTQEDTPSKFDLLKNPDNKLVSSFEIMGPSATSGTFTVLNQQTGTVLFTPTKNFNGSFTFRYYEGISPTMEATMNVTPTDDPQKAHNSTYSYMPGKKVYGRIYTSNIDQKTLTFSVTGAPTKGDLLITNSTTGEFIYTPKTSASGEDYVNYTTAHPGGMISNGKISFVQSNCQENTPFNAGGAIKNPALQFDGKILGSIETQSGTTVTQTLRRLNCDGSIDATFQNLNLDPTEKTYDIKVQNDGKIVVTTTSGTALNIARLNPNGALDSEFGSNGWIRDIYSSTTAIKPDNKAHVSLHPNGNIIVVTTDSFVRAFDSRGQVAQDFCCGGTKKWGGDYNGRLTGGIAIQYDGRLIVFGRDKGVTTVLATGESGYSGGFTRWNEDGTYDTSFNKQILSPLFFPPNNVIVGRDSSILVNWARHNETESKLQWYLSDGSVKTQPSSTWLGGQSAYLIDLATSPIDDSLFATYSYGSSANQRAFGVLRAQSSGALIVKNETAKGPLLLVPDGTSILSTGTSLSTLLDGRYDFNFAKIDPCAGLSTKGPFAYGDGSPAAPFGICSKEQFLNMFAAGDAGHFKLNSDIDMAGVTNLAGKGTPMSPFSGSFDGGRKTVSNLTIEQGLFGNSSGAIIKNLKLENLTVTGTVQVGGIAGSIADSTIIENVHILSGSVSGSDGAVGGLVGHISSSTSKVISSSSKASVAGAYNVGGLAGTCFGTIETSYAQGSVSGLDENSSKIGGLVGYLAPISRSGGKLTQTYSTGVVKTGSSLGGLIGLYGTGATVASSYWNDSTSGQTSAAGNSATVVGATKYSTSQMTTASNYSGWDFVNIWTINLYPEHR